MKLVDRHWRIEISDVHPMQSCNVSRILKPAPPLFCGSGVEIARYFVVRHGQLMKPVGCGSFRYLLHTAIPSKTRFHFQLAIFSLLIVAFY
jgi:hypothetical protein